jgi:transposase-like protein
VGRLARELEINPSDLYRWCREVEEFGIQAFAGYGRRRRERERVAELERKIGQQGQGPRCTEVPAFALCSGRR